MSGNLCRCGAYPKIELAVLRAAEEAGVKQIRKGKMVYEGFEFTITAVYDEEDEWLPAWDADAELAVVGNPAPRIDGAKRVSGAARFTVDVQLPRMLHAAVLRSPVANGSVERLDLEAARARARRARGDRPRRGRSARGPRR